MPSATCPRCLEDLPAGTRPAKCPACGYAFPGAAPAPPLHVTPVAMVAPAGTAAPAPPAVPAATAVPARRRSRRLLAAAIMAAALAGVAVGIFRRGDVPPPAAPDDAPAAPIETATGPAPVPVPAPAPPPEPDRPESTTLGWKFAYDEDGAVTEVVNPAGQATKVRYERDDRKAVRKLVREQPGAAAVAVEFDAAGRRTAMTDAAGRVSYEYDAFGRLTAVARAGGPPVRYAYDDAGRVASVRVGDDYALSYEFDYLGRPAAVGTPAGRVGYAYPAANQVVRTLPNGVRTTRTFAPDGRLAGIVHAAADGAVVAGFAYEYRPDGLVAAVAESSPAGEVKVSYEYDKVHRLTGTSDSRGKRATYRYDQLGNREEVREEGRPAAATTFDWAGRLVRHAGERCAHDAAGNVTKYVGARGPARLTHSPDGQLTRAATDAGELGFGYDGDGNLIRREAGGKATTFVPDPLAGVWRPLLASAAGGESLAYLWDGDAPLAERVGGEWRFFLGNHLESVRCVVDARGAVVERPEYCPFGRPLAGGAGEFRPGFAGLFYDPQAALYLTRARAYDPGLGRFLQLDPQHRVPAGSQQDLIGYTYCGNDPVNFVDPDGCAPAPPPFLDLNRHRLPAGGAHLHQHRREPFPTAPIIPIIQQQFRFLDQHVHQRLADHAGVGFRLGTPEGFRMGVGLTVVGGVIPGAHANPGQEIVGHVADYVPILGNLRAGFSLVLNLAQGNRREAGFDAIGLVGGGLGRFGRDVAVLRQAGNVADGIGYGRTAGQLSQRAWQSPAVRQFGRDAHSVLANSRGPSPATPAPVGGVALAGGGAAFAGLGTLEGVTLDDRGRLVLLTATQPGGIDLPALRLDDVVTVFRSVYEQGEAPFVSIDPDPANPRGPVMLIRHGPGTGNTYVGWILFEADRLMKVYCLGQDNLTGRPFQSAIPGYAQYLPLRFPAAPPPKGREPWERFWIVPSGTAHQTTADGRTALSHVPLKLRTEAMVMKNGKLEAAPKGQALSAGAQHFTKWFSNNMDRLAREGKSRTPAGSGTDAEVPVFAELQRIAVVAAAAERLRDRGVPMPGWMRDYPVRPFPFAGTTPATTVVSGGGAGPFSIYGGVTLSPPGPAPATVSVEVEKLAPAVRAAVAAAADLTPVAVAHGKGELRAVALPAADAVAVGSNRLSEDDLVVPLGAGHDLRLTRTADSFHTPADAIGPAWTLDLPRLATRPGAPAPPGTKAPAGTPPGALLRTVYYELSTPLHSAAAVFSDRRHVPEVGAELHTPAAAGEYLGVGRTKELGAETNCLLFRDGRRWHFDDAGDLVAVEEAPRTVRFHRDTAKRLVRIEGRCGPAAAEVRLEYDDRDRVVRAVGSGGAVAAYSYDEAGSLTKVVRPGGSVRYEYDGPRVAAVLADGAPPRRFAYAAGGRLREERVGAEVVGYEIATDAAGTRVTARGAAGGEVSEYDPRFRPVRRVAADGTVTAWRYPDDGTTEVTTTPPGGRPWVVVRSADGRREEHRVPGEAPTVLTLDAAGRVREVRRGDDKVFGRTWLPNGLPATESDATATRQIEYRPDGTPAAVRVAPAGGRRGVEVTFDEAGRPAALTDEAGAVTRLTYDAAGRPTGRAGPGGTVTVRRDEAGRPRGVTTSWKREESVEYDAAGDQPRRVEVSVAGASEAVDFEHGRPTRVRRFDGGEFNLTYPDRRTAPPYAVRAPNGLELRIDADGSDRVTAVRCGGVYRAEYEYDARGRLTGLRLTAAP